MADYTCDEGMVTHLDSIRSVAVFGEISRMYCGRAKSSSGPSTRSEAETDQTFTSSQIFASSARSLATSALPGSGGQHPRVVYCLSPEVAHAQILTQIGLCE